ncbi:MAG: 3'-5' exonuclease, partial [Clostridia bacterium]|nr:3'-5' exonuclease [Clostridia bacterium]
VEEERRVMYVAITRAKERLFISCAQRRFRYNQEQGFIPSRFLYEAMGEESELKRQINENRRGMEYGYGNINHDSAFPTTPKKTSFLPGVVKPVVQAQKEKVYNADTGGFAAGAKILHKKYGVGTIITVEGAGMGKTAVIAFKDLGIKKFALSNAPIELL